MQPPGTSNAAKTIQKKVFLRIESNETGWFVNFFPRKMNRSLGCISIGGVPDNGFGYGADTLKNLLCGFCILDS